MPERAISGYRLTPAAQKDLAGIWDYTAGRWSADQAESYLNGLREVLETLVTFPEMARERAELDPPVRLHPYRSHLIVYRIEGDRLAVIRVLHMRQNWNAVLAG